MQWGFLGLFLVIILVIIFIAIRSSRKEKIKQKLKLSAERKRRKVASYSYPLLFRDLYKLVEKLELELALFKRGESTLSASQINANYSKLLDSIKNSELYKNSIIDDLYKEEVDLIFNQLENVKPIKYFSDAFLACNLIKAKWVPYSKLIKADEEKKKRSLLKSRK